MNNDSPIAQEADPVVPRALLCPSRVTVSLRAVGIVKSAVEDSGVDPRKVKLAMKVGGEYKLDQIGLRQWQKFSRETRADADVVTATLISIAGQIPDHVNEIRARACWG
ncbi:hypothetical protein [Bradyrhizobium sp. USDA 4486]